jgi:putative oxidoreductase
VCEICEIWKEIDMSIVKSAGQFLLAAIFIQGGASAFAKPGGRVNKVESVGIPQPHQAVVLNGALMMIGGTALAVDIAPKAAAVLLAACLIPTTFVGHAFWQEESAAGRTSQQIQFLKNLAMLGGLLVVLGE